MVELDMAFLRVSGKLHTCTVASLQTACPVQSKILLLVAVPLLQNRIPSGLQALSEDV